jgi:hypothetical protein
MQLRHECIKTILVIQLLSPIIGRNWFLDCMLEFWILCFYSCWCYCVITHTNPSSGPMSKWHVGKLRSRNQLHYFENLPDNWVDIYPPSYQVQCFDGYSFIYVLHLLHPPRYEWQLLKNQGMILIWPNSIYHMGKGTY